MFVRSWTLLRTLGLVSVAAMAITTLTFGGVTAGAEPKSLPGWEGSSVRAIDGWGHLSKKPAAPLDNSTPAAAAAPQPGALLWEDRLDVSSFEQVFSVATLPEAVFAVGFIDAGFQRDSVVRAYHAESGDLLWHDQFDKGSDDFVSGVVTDGRRVFVSGTAYFPGSHYDWTLRAYDPSIGELLWETTFDLAGFEDFSRGTALGAGDGHVFLGGYGRHADGTQDWILRAHDAATGELVWQDHRPGSNGVYTVDVSGNRVVAGGWSTKAGLPEAWVRAFDTRTGEPLWEQSEVGDIDLNLTYTRDVASDGNRVFAAKFIVRDEPLRLTSVITALDARTGSVQWRRTVDSGGGWDPTQQIDAHQGRVYAVGQSCLVRCDATVRSFDAMDGALQWARILELSERDNRADLVVADAGKVFVKSRWNAGLAGGRWVMQALDTRDGELLWQSVEGNDVSIYNMVVDRFRLFIGGRGIDLSTGDWDFLVRAYDIRARTGDVQFPPPLEITLEGTSGEATFDSAFSDPVTLAVSGLIPAQTQAGTVAEGAFNLHPIAVPLGTRFLRVALFDDDVDGNHDLDLYLLDSNGNLIALSAGFTSEEHVDLDGAPPGNYIVVVDGFATDGPQAMYELFVWTLDASDRGNLSASGPSPGPGGTISLAWSGLDLDHRYLGRISYLRDGIPIGHTVVTVIS